MEVEASSSAYEQEICALILLCEYSSGFPEVPGHSSASHIVNLGKPIWRIQFQASADSLARRPRAISFVQE